MVGANRLFQILLWRSNFHIFPNSNKLWFTCAGWASWIRICKCKLNDGVSEDLTSKPNLDKLLCFDLGCCDLTHLRMLPNYWVKAHYNGQFWKSQWQFGLSESSVVALYSNLFEKLSKSEMKNWNLHSNLSNPKEKIIKRINVQFKVDFTNNGTSNGTIQTTPKKLSLWIFFF